LSEKPVTIVFLCWGYSIHAKRRIQIFIDDPCFTVTVVSTYPYHFEGADTVILGSQKQTTNSHVDPKKKLSLLLPAKVKDWIRNGLNLLGIGLEFKRMVSDFRKLKDTIFQVRPDIVFLQTLQYPSFLALFLPREMKLAVTFWNGDLTYFAKWTGFEMIAKRFIVKYGLKRVNLITVNSQTAFRAAIKLGASPQKISLVRYPGADLQIFHPRDKDAARRRLGINARQVILCPRGLGSFFNSDIIIEAAAKVTKRYPDSLFLFISGVGGPQEWERHIRIAKKYGIVDHLRWDGHIDWEEMPWYYCAADLMVSIKTADSCPNCMLEAMACAIPVVMSDTDQNREWIQNDVNGFLCSHKNSDIVAQNIIRTIEDKNGHIATFKKISMAKIRKDADSKVNIEKIKQLISQLADEKSQPSKQC
jgi:glycosyltransferase involved in cell wall biosynthesis